MEEDANDSKLKRILPKLTVPGLICVALVLLIPLISYLAALVSGKGNTVDNIALFHRSATFFFKSVSGSESKFLFPGPGDILLAAVVLLYKKRWQVSLGLLITAGVMYLYGQFAIEPASNSIYNLSLTSPVGVALECLYSALTSAMLIAIAFLPATAAILEKHHWKIILPCNILLFWAQPLWILMTFFSFKKAAVVAKEAQAKAKSSAASNRLWAQVHQRESKRRKGFKKK